MNQDNTGNWNLFKEPTVLNGFSYLKSPGWREYTYKAPNGTCQYVDGA